MPERDSDIGGTLREARMRARIDIGEVEVSTKIRAKYLRAIENEEWDLLPGPVYVKSFLRTYGDYLGLDSRGLVDEYKRRYELSPEVHARPLASVKRERERPRAAPGPRMPAIPSWAVIGVILVAVVIALIVVGTSGSSKSPTNLAVSTHHASQRSGQGSGSRSHHHGSATRTRTSTTTTPVATPKATVKVTPTADEWVCIENVRGVARVKGGMVYAAGDSVSASAKTLYVALGNPEATVSVNGKPYTISGGSDIGLKITTAGATPLSPAPTCSR